MWTAMHWRTERGRHFHGAPTTGNIFACSEHAVGRAGCIGARLVGKVKDHSVSARKG